MSQTFEPCRVGVTATRAGLTSDQYLSLLRILNGSVIRVGVVRELHHGDCVGGDADSHMIADSLGLSIVIHPPDNAALRAFCVRESCASQVVVMPEKPYKERNRDIVDAVDVVVGLPATAEEAHYGGTWSTIRYARSCRKRLIVVNPDGAMSLEGFT